MCNSTRNQIERYDPLPAATAGVSITCDTYLRLLAHIESLGTSQLSAYEHHITEVARRTLSLWQVRQANHCDDTTVGEDS